MYTLRAHTWPHHHVVLTVCFSLDDHVRGSSGTVLLTRALYSTVTSPVFPGLALCSLNTCRQRAPSPPSFLNLPCSLPSNLIPLILSPHAVWFSFSRMQYLPFHCPPSILHAWITAYPLFSCSRPLLQRGCRLGVDRRTDNACRGKGGRKTFLGREFS